MTAPLDGLGGLVGSIFYTMRGSVISLVATWRE